MAHRILNINVKLTKTEIKVMQLVHKGLYHYEIAEILGMAISTEKTHMQNILRKFGLNSRNEASYHFGNLFPQYIN